jgi:MEMO1 family protein
MNKIKGYYIMPHPPIIIPEIGKGEEGKIIKTSNACYKISEKINEIKPKIIIIITPHGPLFRDAIAITEKKNIKGDFGKFGAPHVKFQKNINIELTEKIIGYAEEFGIPIASITSDSQRSYNVKCELDHGSMVPLYFVDKNHTDYELIHITYGILSDIELYKFGMVIQSAVEDGENNVVIICSGDLSHRLSDSGPYEYNPSGPEFDNKLIELLVQGDISGIFNLDRSLIEEAGECGMRSINILLGIMEGSRVKGELLSYEGPFGVGYGVMELIASEGKNGFSLDDLMILRNKIIKTSRENENIYVKLARESLEYYITNKQYMPVPEYITEEMRSEKRGAFVSLKKNGELRGCIGTILPVTKSIAEEIIRNAVEAGEYDPRFHPVDKIELEEINYSVDILMPPEKAKKEELDPQKYGIILRKGGRTGLLLPNLEGVNTVEEQINITLRKAGISIDENYTIEKFEVIRHR